MSTSELRELLADSEEASPGPWTVAGRKKITVRIVDVDDAAGDAVCEMLAPDAALIVALRNEAGALLDTLERYRTALERVAAAEPLGSMFDNAQMCRFCGQVTFPPNAERHAEDCALKAVREALAGTDAEAPSADASREPARGDRG